MDGKPILIPFVLMQNFIKFCCVVFELNRVPPFLFYTFFLCSLLRVKLSYAVADLDRLPRLPEDSQKIGA